MGRFEQMLLGRDGKIRVATSRQCPDSTVNLSQTSHAADPKDSKDVSSFEGRDDGANKDFP